MGATSEEFAVELMNLLENGSMDPSMRLGLLTTRIVAELPAEAQAAEIELAEDGGDNADSEGETSFGE